MKTLALLLALLFPQTPPPTRWAAPVSITVVQTEQAGGSHPFGGSISLWDATIPTATVRMDVFPLDANGSTGIINIQLDKSRTYRIDLVNNSSNPVIRQSKNIYGIFLMPVGHANFKVFLDWTISADPATPNYHGITRIVPDIDFEWPPGSYY